MNDQAPPGQSPDFLTGVAFSEIVRSAIDRALAAAGTKEPLQTGALLAALVEADAKGEWERIWPSYDGGADALLAVTADTGSQASGHSWRGVALSQDLFAALALLVAMIERYDMKTVQPGAVVLALAADPQSGVARRLGELSGCTHAELLSRIQSDLLGVTLDGFRALARQSSRQVEPVSQVPVRWWQVLTRQASALYCVWVAWLIMRTGVGGVTAAVIVAAAVVLSMTAALLTLVSAALYDGPGKWTIEWRPRFASPSFMILLFVIGLFGVLTVAWRHHVPALYVPNLVITGSALALALLGATISVARQQSPAPPPAVSPLRHDFQYRTLLGTSAVLAAGVGLVAGYIRLGLVSTPLTTTSLRWSTRVLLWIQRSFTGATLGKWFDHGDWPLLVTVIAFACCYFCALAAQLLLTKPGKRAAIWAAGSCTVGLLFLTVSYFPQALGPGSAAAPASHPAIARSACRTSAFCQAGWADAAQPARTTAYP